MQLGKSFIRTLNSVLVVNMCAAAAMGQPAASADSGKEKSLPKSEHSVSTVSTVSTASTASTASTDRPGGEPGHMVSPSARRPHMDVAFCIDTTGSMQAEIDMVKTKTKEMVAKLSSGKPTPVIRVGLVAYRDNGDEYVTKVFPFSEDIDQVVKDISNLQARGGGDGPEALDQGLHAAFKELKWDKSSHTAKLLFLIGDAGPHGYKTDIDWRQDCRDAIKEGIQVNTMGCSGLERYPQAQGTSVFQEIAKLTDGKYETLAYRQEIVDARGKHTTIVHSGGESYKVSAGYSGAWKSAVAKGALDKMTASPVEAMAAPTGEAMAPMSAAATNMAAMVASPHMISRARQTAVSGFPASAPSRGDNNLDALMLDAAKEKAEKTLHIGY